MNIAENIKCKEFTFKCRPTGSRLRGMENTWEYEIWLERRELKRSPAMGEQESQSGQRRSGGGSKKVWRGEGERLAASLLFLYI